MTSPDISVIILNYNSKDFIEKCLYSIEKQESKTLKEIIVIDNASVDGSADMIKSKFPEVKLICNKKNVGFSAAVNQGLGISTAEYKVILNSDTVLLNNAFTLMKGFMCNNPAAGAVRPKVLNPDNSLQRQGSGIFRFFKNPEKVHRLDWISGCCVMLKQDVINDVGFFDERFFFYNEDLDYSKRMKKKGWALYSFPEAVITHHWGGSSKKTEYKLLIEGYRGGCYLCEKHYGKFALFFYKVLILLELIVKMLVMSFHPLLKEEECRKKNEAYSRIVKMILNLEE